MKENLYLKYNSKKFNKRSYTFQEFAIKSWNDNEEMKTWTELH